MENFEDNLGTMETQLKLWEAKLDELVLKTAQADLQATVEYRRRIDELKAKCLIEQSKLDELKGGDRAKWESFKTGVGSAWHELEAAFKQLTN